MFVSHFCFLAKVIFALDDYKFNARGTWRILNEVINRQKKTSDLPSVFKIGEVECNDPVEIANKFSEYFTNLGPSLADKIPTSPKSHMSFLTTNFVNSMFVDSATRQEIIEIANSFRTGTAAGYDNLPMGIIKEVISVISEPITHTINLSLSSGVVPRELKIARVIPIFKTGDRGLFNNYRPVSVPSIFFKLLERVMYNRLLNFLNKYNILSINQFGFRKNHSTSLALIHLYDKISTAIDNREYTVGIFLDLSKAFDTVNHEIMLAKLEHYGVRGNSLQWFKSYLSNREQFVQFNGHCSSTKRIVCGVPQGSILGPLLFLLYINDLCEASDALEFILFADDTNVFFSHKNPELLMHKVYIELCKLTCWLQANKLSLNIKKTKFMVFRPRQKRLTLDNFAVKLCDTNIERVKEVVFLGVILDEHRSWKSHIAHLSSKVSRSIGIIYKSSFCLHKSALRMLYFSLIYPYLYYCISVWGSTNPTNLNRIFVLQKRAIRAISKSPFDAHTGPIFKELNILSLHNIYLAQIGKIMLQYKAGLLPTCFENIFLLRSQIHVHNTRDANYFSLPKCKTNIRLFSFQYQGQNFLIRLVMKYKIRQILLPLNIN